MDEDTRETLEEIRKTLKGILGWMQFFGGILIVALLLQACSVLMAV